MENFNAVYCSNCGVAHRLNDPCPIVLNRVELPCPSCAAKDARIAELEKTLAVSRQASYDSVERAIDAEQKLVLAEKVVEAARKYKYWREAGDGTMVQKTCNILEAALRAYDAKGG